VLAEMARKYFKMEALFLEPGTRTGMAILYETPQEVGADRVADAVAAFEKYGGPCIVVDLGTAITFDCISAKGEYVGGVIMPGIGIAAEALFQRTAKLPRVEIREPDRVIGTNTINSIQSGLFYGAVDAIDGMLDRLCAVLGKPTKVIATGGQAPLVAGASKYKPTLDSSLTLDGLRIIYHRNHPTTRRK
jgi:type III pantothenate kinase